MENGKWWTNKSDIEHPISDIEHPTTHIRHYSSLSLAYHSAYEVTVSRSSK